MPYSANHKQETRSKIIETARILFNRHGFDGVSIDQVMEAVGMTRGGFYNHFKNKDALYTEAVSSFLMGRGAQWRKEAGIDDSSRFNQDMARQMVDAYLSSKHLKDLDGQCPMIALSSDIARATPQVRASYQILLEAMVGLFTHSLPEESGQTRQKALSLAALSVGGMILARTLPESELVSELRDAAMKTANQIIDNADEQLF